MELTDLLIGVFLTIIGVVTVELIIHYIKERIEIDRLITSLEFEIAKNVEIAAINKKFKMDKKRESYIPFEVIASHNFSLSVTKNIIIHLGKDAVMSYFIGYIQCERFNREYRNISATLYSMEDECFTEIEDNFKKFLTLRDIFNKSVD